MMPVTVAAAAGPGRYSGFKLEAIAGPGFGAFSVSSSGGDSSRIRDPQAAGAPGPYVYLKCVVYSNSVLAGPHCGRRFGSHQA